MEGGERQLPQTGEDQLSPGGRRDEYASVPEAEEDQAMRPLPLRLSLRHAHSVRAQHWVN